MDEFNTKEKVEELFKSVDGWKRFHHIKGQ